MKMFIVVGWRDGRMEYKVAAGCGIGKVYFGPSYSTGKLGMIHTRNLS